MIALDTNILVGLLVNSHASHKVCLKWFENCSDNLSTSSSNLSECLRILTHPKIFEKPYAVKPALRLLNNFIKSQNIEILPESENWWFECSDWINDQNLKKGEDIFDARIAFCLRFNGVKEICTFDAGFKKYEFLKLISPQTISPR